MDHSYVEEHGLIERYFPGLLTADEEVRFEEHLAGCRECQEQLALDRGLRRGLQAVAAAEAAGRAAAGQLALVAWLARRSRGVQAAILAAALLVVALLPAAVLLRRSAPEGSGIAAGATPLVVLSRFRSGPGEPAATLDLARLEDQVVLAVEIDENPEVASYRVTVGTADGRRLFRQGGLRPNAFDALMLSFPASFFAPGNYRLLVEAIDAAGAAAEIGGYPFRVVAGR